MQDRHDNLLTIFYEKSIQEAKRYLETKYLLTTCNAKDEEILEISRGLPSEYREFLKIELDGSLRHFTFILSIPDTFPDTFPKIHLTKKDYEEIYPVPHVDKNRFVCTRDPDVVSLSDKKSGEALEELLNIAVEILEQGIKKENESHFINEFLAYWDERVKYCFLNLSVPKDRITYLTVFKLSKDIFGSKYIISDSERYVEKWLVPFDINIDKSEKIKVLYLPLYEFSPVFFQKDEDVLNILKSLNNKEYIQMVENYFNQDRRHHIIISSFLIKDERILFGWQHKGWRGILFKGFRKNHVPLSIRLMHTENNSIKKIKITRLDRERIFKRGGAMTLSVNKDVSIVLIGCGSLGSYLAMSLSRCGISKFLLIDKDYLAPENTPRHLCGFVDASRKMKKVEAVKKRLIEHFPHVECQTHHGDILQLLQTVKVKLEGYDLMVVAIGNMSVERRLNYLLRKGLISYPIVYLWIEPFGVGGHMLYVHPRKGGCYDCCFDENGEFLYSVVAPKQIFQKRESGCQSTFLPYSSSDVECFISIACKKILQIMEEKVEISTLYTWLGDFEDFKKLAYRIRDIYVTDFPYRIIKKKILPQEMCSLCRKNI